MIFGFSKMRAVATRYNDSPAEASRPFDRGRDGFVLGEGRVDAGARARGPRARARRARSTRPSTATARPATPTTACRWIPTASRSSARCSWRSSASGRAARGDRLRQLPRHVDGAERRGRSAVRPRSCFGATRRRVPGSSTKSMIGHPQGASGAAGIVTAALALRDGFLPPTINHRDPDPDCDIDVIPNTGRPRGRRPRCATAWGSARRTARSCWDAERGQLTSPLAREDARAAVVTLSCSCRCCSRRAVAPQRSQLRARARSSRTTTSTGHAGRLSRLLSSRWSPRRCGSAGRRRVPSPASVIFVLAKAAEVLGDCRARRPLDVPGARVCPVSRSSRPGPTGCCAIPTTSASPASSIGAALMAGSPVAGVIAFLVFGGMMLARIRVEERALDM